MSKKSMAVSAALLLCCLAGAAFAAEVSGTQHRGELMAVDKDSKTITVKILTNGNKESHVYQIKDGFTIIRDENQKTISLSDLKAGQHVVIVSDKEKGDRVAKEVTIKAEKKKKKH